jgi:hypothetical protein
MEEVRMRRVLCGAALVVLIAVGGCADRGISVNATSEDRDIFQNPEGEKSGLSLGGADSAVTSGRAPFINLSAYDWDYSRWLESISDVVADLRLPESKDTYVEVRFFPGDRAPAPLVGVVCVAAELECRRLEAQVERLGGWPALPGDFPHEELVVKLSRIP